MRAEARGLSGILMPSTPTDLRKRAPSISFRMSVPLGGTISTIVRNSPAASFAPSLERFSNDRAGAGDGAATAPDALAPTTLERASLARNAAFITRMCSGVDPQQ